MKITNEHLEDWRRGKDSTTSPLKRLELMKDWLNSNKKELLSSIEDKVIERYDNVGFDKLPMYD